MVHPRSPILALALAVAPALFSFRTNDAAGLKEEEPVPSAVRQDVDGAWTPIVSLRDKTDTFPGSHEMVQDDGGWWVSPIHVNLLANGNVLVTGWSRPAEKACTDHQGRRNGTSFVLDPASLDVSAAKILEITPINEQPKIAPSASEPWRSPDVLYCSGHAPLPDGRILFMGGGRYWNLGDVEFPQPFEQQEFGLPYARIFQPGGGQFARVETNNPGGPIPPTNDTTWNSAPYAKDAAGHDLRKSWYEQGMMWYPTNTRLPDGRILINGGLARRVPIGGIADPIPGNADHKKEKWDYHNRSVTIFDSKAYDQGRNPWSVWVSHEKAPLEVSIDVFDYPRVFVLPKPVVVKGKPRHVAIYGGAGWAPGVNGFQPAITFLSLDPSVPEAERFAMSPNSRRPNGGDTNRGKMHETTSVMTGDGQIVIMGGGNGGDTEGQQIDVYDPYTDQWRSSLSTKITRHKAASTLLPDGTVLVANGEIFYEVAKNIGDRRQPTIFDPKAGTYQNLAPWADDNEMRGYHNVSLLLKDGRVLIGGGRIYDKANDSNPYGDEGAYRIGCERPELRIYSPPYLFKGPRPIVKDFAEPMQVKAGGGAFTLRYDGPQLKQDGGVVLMALGAYTHSFDQNQRYVGLKYSKLADGELAVTPPENTQIAPPGEYNLFIVSEAGVPSVGKTVRIE